MKTSARISIHTILLLALIAQILTAKLEGYGQVTQGGPRDEEIAQLINRAASRSSSALGSHRLSILVGEMNRIIRVSQK